MYGLIYFVIAGMGFLLFCFSNKARLIFRLIHNYIKISFIELFSYGLIYHINTDKKHKYVTIYDDREYVIQFPIRRGPTRFEKITVPGLSGSPEIDITNKMTKYLGPYSNFFGIPKTPKDFDYNCIYLYMNDGSKKTFTENQIIEIN